MYLRVCFWALCSIPLISICLSFHHHHAVLITVALHKFWKELCSLSRLFWLVMVFESHEFQDGFFCFLQKSWNFDRNSIEFVDCFGQYSVDMVMILSLLIYLHSSLSFYKTDTFYLRCGKEMGGLWFLLSCYTRQLELILRFFSLPFIYLCLGRFRFQLHLLFTLSFEQSNPIHTQYEQITHSPGALQS